MKPTHYDGFPKYMYDVLVSFCRVRSLRCIQLKQMYLESICSNSLILHALFFVTIQPGQEFIFFKG